jgi:hypothetical protein
LDSFLVGSRRNYVRPSVTYAAGLGNTAMRHIRLHPEDYTYSIPAHRALPQYIATMLERRPGLYMSITLIALFTAIYDDRRRTNEVYERAIDSIFALKSKNFLIKQGERIFLETLLIMFHAGVVVPLELEGETSGEAGARFIGEVHSMLAEIERHRDFRLSNIPLNFFEILEAQKKNSIWLQLQLLWHKPMDDPFHVTWRKKFIDGVEFDTPWDIIRDQRSGLVEEQHNSDNNNNTTTTTTTTRNPQNYQTAHQKFSPENETNFIAKLDSSGVGSLYGLFYPLITRYHHIPTKLSIQAVPQSIQREIRLGTAPLSKLSGRVRDALHGSVLHDQFELTHRNEEYSDGGDGNIDFQHDGITRLDRNPMKLHTTHELPAYWHSDIEAELYNSYYLQRASNLIKRCNDVDGKVATSLFGESNLRDLMTTYLSKAHRVLLEAQFKAKTQDFSPGDSPIFRHYYSKYNLVPYLNSIQHEMSELIVLRQRLMKVGRAVGVDPEIEQFSPSVLQLLDPFDTRPKSDLRELTFDLPTGERITVNQENTRQKYNLDDPNLQGPTEKVLKSLAPQLQHRDNVNPDDLSLRVPGASMSFDSTSSLSKDFEELNDRNLGDFARVSRHLPKLPTALSNTVDSLYQPVRIHNLIETIMEKQFNVKGLNTIVDSLHHSQHTSQPTLYPTLDTHAPALSQEQYYVRSMFNPLQNAFGVSDEEKYVRGLLGCIDLTLMRNAVEYQRWLHLVPTNTYSIWSTVHYWVESTLGLDLDNVIDPQTIENNAINTIFKTFYPDPNAPGPKNGYLDRSTLPTRFKRTYEGKWVPLPTKKAYEDNVNVDNASTLPSRLGLPDYVKPVYYDTGIKEESWGEMFYRLMGWQHGVLSAEEHVDIMTQKLNDAYGDKVSVSEPDFPIPGPNIHVTVHHQNETMRNTIEEGQERLKEQKMWGKKV